MLLTHCRQVVHICSKSILITGDGWSIFAFKNTYLVSKCCTHKKFKGFCWLSIYSNLAKFLISSLWSIFFSLALSLQMSSLCNMVQICSDSNGKKYLTKDEMSTELFKDTLSDVPNNNYRKQTKQTVFSSSSNGQQSKDKNDKTHYIQ